jgi:thiol-disulfide isomerase/thioredoxin
MNADRPVAPELQVSGWFNVEAPLALESLRGRVVLLHAFQMLCPGCISHGLPQAQRVHKLFPAEQVAVIGLHTVFEHHAVMGPDALEVFIEEYGWPFPIAVDAPGDDGNPLPLTMRALKLRGTPSLVLLDREGRACFEHFGAIDDLALGALIGQLVAPPS